MEAAGLTMIDCARARLRLTESACARFWLNSNPVAPPVWQGCHRCHGCPAGAARVGVAVDPWQAVRDALAHTCVRCRRLSGRIIGKRLCPSCFNRERELIRGRNAKGHVPRVVARRLFRCRVLAVQGDAVAPVERDIAAGPLELILSQVSRAKAQIAFGWAPPPMALAA
jgi:hypothetical protein